MQTMTPEQAEAEIVRTVQMIDTIRAGTMADDEKAKAIAIKDQEIRALKIITGPREASGESHIILPRMKIELH